MMQGTYEARVARQNEAIEAERGRQSIVQGQIESRDFYRSLGRLKGQQEASMAANGVDLGFGTPLTVQQDTAQGGEDDATNMHRAQLERLKGYDISGANFQSEAAAAKFRGRSAMVNSAFEAGTSLMGGFQQQRAFRARSLTGRTGG